MKCGKMAAPVYLLAMSFRDNKDYRKDHTYQATLDIYVDVYLFANGVIVIDEER